MPEQFDGFIMEKPYGWKVEAQGMLIAESVPSFEMAQAVLEEHAPGKPHWRVAMSGEAEALNEAAAAAA